MIDQRAIRGSSSRMFGGSEAIMSGNSRDGQVAGADRPPACR